MTACWEKAQAVQYDIEVEGIVDPRWSEWFSEIEVRFVPSPGHAHRTTLIAHLPDQAALPALLARVTGLNLKIISVTPEAAPASTWGRMETD